ncbi:MAG: hypothetical protein KME16_13345 [Scytolyngbya sp. HA4215-MV1]|nr:hypothetical protein [Scytolyngbya sp. HA4215-MV1]
MKGEESVKGETEESEPLQDKPCERYEGLSKLAELEKTNESDDQTSNALEDDVSCENLCPIRSRDDLSFTSFISPQDKDLTLHSSSFMKDASSFTPLKSSPMKVGDRVIFIGVDPSFSRIASGKRLLIKAIEDDRAVLTANGWYVDHEKPLDQLQKVYKTG